MQVILCLPRILALLSQVLYVLSLPLLQHHYSLANQYFLVKNSIKHKIFSFSKYIISLRTLRTA